MWKLFKEQFAIAPLVGKYYIPGETNDFWYALGGVLALSLAAQIVNGAVLAVKYIPDASFAYGIVSGMLHSDFWGFMVSFHYFNSFLLFILVFAHMMRVFLSAAYRSGKKGLWFIGILLMILLLSAYLTGEALHWDEVGFAVPWHISEILQATGFNYVLHYNFSDLLNPSSATGKLAQIYAMHISVFPILIILAILAHFYLIRAKGVSLPFWKKRTGNMVPFSTHIKLWLVYGSFMIGAVILLAVFVGRSPGTAPQLLPSSPLYQAHKGPGALGFKPSFPISWTHGWNVFVEEHFDLSPDIWGTVIAMALMLGSLVAVPFVDTQKAEPASAKEAFDIRKRRWVFLAMALFWVVFFIGIIQNAVAAAG